MKNKSFVLGAVVGCGLSVVLVACEASRSRDKRDTAGSPSPRAATAEPITSEHGGEDLYFQESVQLTFGQQFLKAGEAYFDHATPPRRVVFQAIPTPAQGQEPEPFYSMYVAELRYDAGRIVGIDTPQKISPAGSANTCGWFHPTRPDTVMFGSTLAAPARSDKPGFRVGTRKYVWQFPDEMEIVEVSGVLTPNVSTPRVVFKRSKYDAECSYSSDGRFILYTNVREQGTVTPNAPEPKDDGDIWVYDTKTDKHHTLIAYDGYDGGPFFSPDGKRICYRSDRRLDDHLQIFVADLKFEDGVPVGIEREHALTNDNNVNWAPYWHPSGTHLLYASSGVSHANYEVFAVDVPKVGETATALPTPHRVTFAWGADVLPAYSDDGKWMIWTSQRGAPAAGEMKGSSQVWAAKVKSTGNNEASAR